MDLSLYFRICLTPKYNVATLGGNRITVNICKLKASFIIQHDLVKIVDLVSHPP